MRIHESYIKLAEGARDRLKRGKTDTGVPDVIKADRAAD